jgi:hypothetical protein
MQISKTDRAASLDQSRNTPLSERNNFDYHIGKPPYNDKPNISIINWQAEKKGHRGTMQGKETYLDDVIRLAKKMNSQTQFLKI